MGRRHQGREDSGREARPEGALQGSLLFPWTPLLSLGARLELSALSPEDFPQPGLSCEHWGSSGSAERFMALKGLI